MNIGDKIKIERKNKGLTQSELAKLVGISRSYLGSVEINNNTPSLELLNRISNKLNIPISNLLSGEEEIRQIEISKKRTLIDSLVKLTSEDKIIWTDKINIALEEEITNYFYSYKILYETNYNNVSYSIIKGKSNIPIYELSEQLTTYNEILLDDDVERIMRDEPEILFIYIYFIGKTDKNVLIDEIELQCDIENLLKIVSKYKLNIDFLDDILKTLE